METRWVLLGSERLSRSTAVTSRQCPPCTGYQREGGELRVGRKEKGHLLTNIYFRTPALKASSESSLLPGVRGRIPESHMPMSRLKILEKKKSQLYFNEGQYSRQSVSPEQTVNLNHGLHWDIIISIFIYVYLYICYVQKTEISGTIKPLPPPL